MPSTTRNSSPSIRRRDTGSRRSQVVGESRVGGIDDGHDAASGTSSSSPCQRTGVCSNACSDRLGPPRCAPSWVRCRARCSVSRRRRSTAPLSPAPSASSLPAAPGSTSCTGGCTAPTRCSPHLVEQLAWRQHTVPMYERMVVEPRLTSWWTVADGPEPLAVLRERTPRARPPLPAHGSRRSGSTSIATATTPWPGTATVCIDRSDAMVAILSVGEPRALQLRPGTGVSGTRSGSATRSFALGDGTLARDGRHVPGHLAAPGPEVRTPHRAADVDHVPARQCRPPGRPGGAARGVAI